MMKWINPSLFIIWLVVVAVGFFWVWQDFSNATTLTHGGYLYDDNGEVVGLWDGWGEANYPVWMFPIWWVASIFTSMPLWWMILYWGIGAWLMLRYILIDFKVSNQEEENV